MRVKVRRLRELGQHLLGAEHTNRPPVVGELSIGESRDIEFGRTLVCARLTDAQSESGSDLVPVLVEAKVIWAVANKFRLCGIERVDKGIYSQTWSVELA